MIQKTKTTTVKKPGLGRIPTDDLFAEIDAHLLRDERPSEFINRVFQTPAFKEYPFDMLLRLKGTPQSPVHHPEGDVWNHTMLVTDEAAKRREASKDPEIFMWAALLHDIGKPDTTRIKKGRITSYNHEKVGAELAVRFLSAFDLQEEFIRRVSALVRWHMQLLFVVKDMPFANVGSMSAETDIDEVALLGLCDRMGRKAADLNAELENIRLFKERLRQDNH